MADPKYFYKVTECCSDGTERVLYADTNIYQARHAYHSHDPCGDITAVNWYGINLTELDEPQPGTMPSTPQPGTMPSTPQICKTPPT